jgi:hypothetical protein
MLLGGLGRDAEADVDCDDAFLVAVVVVVEFAAANCVLMMACVYAATWT